MLTALVAVVALFVVANVARQRVARREADADDEAAMQRRARMRELRSRANDRRD